MTSCLILNPVPESIFFIIANFEALFNILFLSICRNLCNLALVMCVLMSKGIEAQTINMQ